MQHDEIFDNEMCICSRSTISTLVVKHELSLRVASTLSSQQTQSQASKPLASPIPISDCMQIVLPPCVS